MKFSINSLSSTARTLVSVLALTALTGYVAHAHPYASGVTGTNSTGDVGFFMNEAGATVTVTFEDNSTLLLGVLAKGTNFFNASGHTSFRISCFKIGTGSPTLISDDANLMSQWTNGSGFAVNKNAKIGRLFGRLYAANSFANADKAVGIYAMNADQSQVAFAGPNTIPGTANTWFGSVNGNFKSPDRIRVAPNNKLLVADGQGLGNQNQVYLFEADLSSAVALLGPSLATGAGDH